MADLNQQEHIEEIIKVSACYTIMEYVCVNARKTKKVVDHEASLRIGSMATFTPITVGNIPTYYFRLATHELLKVHREYPRPLADYIGQLQKKFFQHTNKVKKLKKFLIQDEWTNEVEITF
ncbi:uncharacterized protein LOC143637361 [Bidens hawaiensis]|uniref:uncharacterized protein LOC143637361 n=1 Tax=Bidens hawaiensis TaxID=980011 RepID=UPI00404A987C